MLHIVDAGEAHDLRLHMLRPGELCVVRAIDGAPHAVRRLMESDSACSSSGVHFPSRVGTGSLKFSSTVAGV